jgi:CheY-like chemotaxis protein
MVLLVVPFADEREMFADYLRAVGIHVIATDSAEAARREVTQDSAPDVVVLRGWSGRASSDCFVFARGMRQSHITRNTPIILLTTDGFADQTVATQAGCDAVFLLPVSLDDLAAAIQRLADRTHRTVA